MYSAENQNEMVECPYNKVHRMLRKRLQQHLLKCRLSYPDVELRKCPFNQTHLIPEPEFVHHVTSCSDRKLITQYKYDAPAEDEEELRVKHEPIECEENWDDTEVEDYNPKNYVQKAKIIRLPEGALPSERKAFIKQERKRLGDYDSDDEKSTIKKIDLDRLDTSEEESNYAYNRRRPMTPPPPTNVAWFEDVKGNKNQKFQERKIRNENIAGTQRKSQSNDYPYQNKRPKHSGSHNQEFHVDTYINNRSYQGNIDQNNVHTLDDDPYYNSGSSHSQYKESRDLRECAQRSRNKYPNYKYY